jgi:hypothetical protein
VQQRGLIAAEGADEVRSLAEIAHYTRSVEQEALAEAAMAKARTKLSKPVGDFDKRRKKANENNGRN